MSNATTRLVQQIKFIAEADKLKEIFRQTINTQSRRQENDAEHSWHLCLCVIVLAEHANRPALDILRVLKMVIIHDLVEIDAGDTFAYDTAAMAGQHEREAIAAERLFGLLPPDQFAEFRALWDEFEAGATPEQAVSNETNGKTTVGGGIHRCRILIFAAAMSRAEPMMPLSAGW